MVADGDVMLAARRRAARRKSCSGFCQTLAPSRADHRRCVAISKSTLAQNCDVLLDVNIEQEASVR